MGNHSKLIGAILGNVIAIMAVWLASFGLAECVPASAGLDLADAAGDQVCSIAGFTTAQITTAAMAILNTALVYLFPANRPPA